MAAAFRLCGFQERPQDLEAEVKNLHRKIKAGADFFLTQPIYRPNDGQSLLEAYGAKHGKLDKPVLAGILPLVSAKHANFLHNEVPGITVEVIPVGSDKIDDRMGLDIGPRTTAPS